MAQYETFRLLNKHMSVTDLLWTTTWKEEEEWNINTFVCRDLVGETVHNHQSTRQLSDVVFSAIFVLYLSASKIKKNRTEEKRKEKERVTLGVNTCVFVTRSVIV